MKPQRPQRNTLRTLKEYSFKENIEKIIPCVLCGYFFTVRTTRRGK